MLRRLWSMLPIFAIVSSSLITKLDAQTYPQKAADGVTQLQTWYQTSTGTWSAPAAWWNWANSTTVLANCERILNDNSYYSALSDTFSNAPAVKGWTNFENDYYDDMGWWALGWIEAYDATNDSSYLSMAETIFSDITNGWDTTTCGGGLWWHSNPNTYKAAIQNELFLELAAKLANRTTGSTSTTYLNWANKEWNWFKASGMINSSNLINNGLDSTNPNACVNDGKTEWTYNQGVILAGLAELYIADHDSTLLPQAAAIANAAITNLVDTNGILTEAGTNGTAAPQFKGIFMRGLMALNAVAPSYAYQTFIDNNANSIWSTAQGPNSNCPSQYEFGVVWDAACDQADAIRQTSAVDALLAAVAVRGSAFVGPAIPNRYSEIEMYAVDGSGTVWHNWQTRGTNGASDLTSWNGWTSFTMGGVVAQAGPAATISGIYGAAIFVPTSADVYVNWQLVGNQGNWNGWTDMGSTSHGLTSLQAQNGLYGMTVFGRDSAGNIWYASQATPASSWSSFAQVTGQVVHPGYTVGCNESGLLEIFGADTSGNVWTNTQTSSTAWSGWTKIGGKTVKPYLTVTRNLDGNLQVWGVDTSNTAVWTNWQSTNGGSWQSSWQNLGNVGGGVTIQPGFVVGLNANGSLQFFGVGGDGHVYTIWHTSSGWTSSWTQLGSMVLNSYLTAGMTSDGRIQLFAVATGSPYGIYSNWQTSSNGYGSASWNGWTSFGGGGYKFYSGQP
ncbi:MAG TPA: glycoside hydrolase family 76 protein [Acidobacteriaceae bacterium]|nr:glycoside hydrolase family 76 protein [Acidobacteriaceae bacterium]